MRERLIVIDAIDEAGDAERNTLVELLARNAVRLPDWIGVVATSRSERAVTGPLQELNPYVMDTRTEANRADLREYLRHALHSQLQELPSAEYLVGKVIQKSEGVFLYVERFCDDVRNCYLSLAHPEQFPQGLGGIYFQWFKRQFPRVEVFRKGIRPALRAILASHEPLPVAILRRLFNWQDEEFRDFTGTLGSLFTVASDGGPETIKPYHKSLTDWLTNEVKSGPYFVSAKEGQRLLSDFCRADYQKNPLHWSPYTLRYLAVYFSDTQDWRNLCHVHQDERFVGAAVRADGLDRFLERLYLPLSRYERTEERRYLYVASTFEDMKAERDVLETRVFPALRELAAGHGVRLETIDMNWGIRAQQSLDQQTIERCLAAISHCQRRSQPPIFLFLLGERYGWCPLPSRIEARELEDLLAVLSGDDRHLITLWYRRDDNLAPPEYCLLSRVGQFEDPAFWSDVEAHLRSILLAAISLIGWSASHPRRAKYETSAVHAEILAGLGPTPMDRRHAFGFLRDVGDRLEDAALHRLKAELRALMPENIYEYSEAWGGAAHAPNNCGDWCEDAYRRLTQELTEGVAAQGERRTPLDMETEANNQFAERSSRVFVGREDVLDAIIGYVMAGGNRPLLVHGPPGSGKSSVMARASWAVQANTPSGMVIRRFIGVTPSSSDSRSLLDGLCQEIALRYGIAFRTGGDQYEALLLEFVNLLAVSTSDIRVGHVVPTLSDTLAHSLDAPLGVVQAYVEEPGEE